MNILKKIFGLKNKTSKSNKIDTNYLRDNYQTLINYWGGIIEGEYKLEDGSKFDSWTVYNPNKYLKFKMKELEIACVYVGKSIKKKGFYFISGILDTQVNYFIVLLRSLNLRLYNLMKLNFRYLIQRSTSVH